MRSRLRHFITREVQKRRDRPAFLLKELRAAAREIVRFHRRRGLRARILDRGRMLTLDFEKSGDGSRFAVVALHEPTGSIRCERRVRDGGDGDRKDPRRPDCVYVETAEDLLSWYAAVYTETSYPSV